MDPRAEHSKSKLMPKPTKKRRGLNRMSSPEMPTRFRQSDDTSEDVTAPARAAVEGAQYMNQSIFSMIAAAGSRADFNTRFDDSSDSEDEDVALDEGSKHAPSSITIEAPKHQRSQSEQTSSRSQGQTAVGRDPLQSVRITTENIERITSRDDSSPSTEHTMGSSRSDPRDAPMMSRLLTAEFQATVEDVDAQLELDGMRGASQQAGSLPATLLSTRLMEIFAFDAPEEVIAEYPCWLLQSVLLQGYLYLTRRHVCFYAYLPRKSQTVTDSGYLFKKARSTGKYHRYWFSLKGDVLSYYMDPSDVYFPQGTIDLRYGISANLVAEKAKQKDCKELILTTDHRTYHFKADTATSARSWVKSLQKTIFRSHNDGDSVKISLPVANVLDLEVSPVVEFAETVKLRVIESEDSYAVDDYFFTFFSNGADAVQSLSELVHNNEDRQRVQFLSPDGLEDNKGSPQASRSTSRGSSRPAGSHRTRSVTPVRGSVRATIRPFEVTESGRMSPRRAIGGEASPSSDKKASVDLTSLGYGRASFDRGRSGSAGRRRSEQIAPASDSPRRKHESFDSTACSEDKETDSSVAFQSPSIRAHMSASQILDRSDMFHAPTLDHLETVASRSENDEQKDSQDTTHSSSAREQDPMAKSSIFDPKGKVAVPQSGIPARSAGNFLPELQIPRNLSSPSLQDIVKSGAYPLQRAGAFASYLRNRSNRLATESMTYIEKVSGMLSGPRKHYGANEGVLMSNDQDVDPEDDEANVGYGDRFRTHFALPPSEKLQATYFGYLHRVLPLYGKIYVSNRKFCFRSLLPGTRTKLILPLHDIENVVKEKGFRFGYHGLVLVVRGHEELFFEFRASGHRDDCTVTLLRSLEAVHFLEGGTAPNKEDEDDAEVAKTEHRMLQEARRPSTAAAEPIPPESPQLGDDHTETPPILFQDPHTAILNFKPPAGLRITCLTIGSRGDVQPYIALCIALKEQGHKPKIATHKEFQPWIEKYGIEFGPVDGDPAELMRICIENGMFTYSFLKEASTKFRSWIDELLVSAWKACQDSDVLIESPSAMAGIHIAEALEIPYFRAFTMPWTRTRAYPHAFAVPEHKIGGAYNYFSYVMFDNVFWKAIAGQVNRWRKKVLELQSTSLDKMQPNKVPFLYMFSPHVVVPPLDYSDWVRVTGYWFLDEGDTWTPPQDLLSFIQEARKDKKKIVYVGFGSIVVSDPAALTRTIIDSVLKADVRCILAKGWSDRLGDPAAIQTEVPLPAEIHQIKSAPHDWLFKQIDAAVHHGGCGTTGASLRAGVPTVIKPFFGDQFFFGSRVEDLGVGICLKKINVSVLSRALWEATHDERMIVKARILGEQIRREQGVQTAIQAIYRDLDYAKTLIKVRKSADAALQDDLATTEGIEESWTFIGDESDPDLREKLQSWGRAGMLEGRAPRVSLEKASTGGGIKSIDVADISSAPVRKGSTKKK